MPKMINDEELRAYQKRLGVKQYRDLYLHEANKVRRLTRNNTRYSGEKYVNSPEKLNAIKEKYKNGVSKEIINEWVNNL